MDLKIQLLVAGLSKDQLEDLLDIIQDEDYSADEILEIMQDQVIEALGG